MTASAETLYQAALKLSEAERSELADKLIDSIDPQTDEGWTEVWDAEIARRIDDLKQCKIQTIPWAEARRIITGKKDVGLN